MIKTAWIPDLSKGLTGGADGQNGGPNHMSVTSYRLKGMFASSTHWVGGIALGRSMDEVNPRSYG